MSQNAVTPTNNHMEPTMKAIKITESKAAAIEAALKEVNGKAYDHAYTNFSEIEYMVHQAEASARAILNVKDLPGAQWTETSGAQVAKKYRNSRNSRKATTVTIERRSSAWYMVAARSVEILTEGGGPGTLILTKAQDEAAKAKFATKYRVAA